VKVEPLKTVEFAIQLPSLFVDRLKFGAVVLVLPVLLHAPVVLGWQLALPAEVRCSGSNWCFGHQVWGPMAWDR
jgi:hypothetical protein